MMPVGPLTPDRVEFVTGTGGFAVLNVEIPVKLPVPGMLIPIVACVVKFGGEIVEDGRKLLPENAELGGIPDDGTGVPPEEPMTDVELPKGNGAVAHEVDNGAELVGGVGVGSIPPVPIPDALVAGGEIPVELPVGRGADVEGVAGKPVSVSDGATAEITVGAEELAE